MYGNNRNIHDNHFDELAQNEEFDEYGTSDNIDDEKQNDRIVEYQIDQSINHDTVIPLDEKANINKQLKQTFKIGLIGEILAIMMMFIIINLQCGTTWNASKWTRKHMNIAIWLPSSSAYSGIIEQNLRTVVSNHLDLNLNYKFEYILSNDLSLSDALADTKNGHYFALFAVNEGI